MAAPRGSRGGGPGQVGVGKCPPTKESGLELGGWAGATQQPDGCSVSGSVGVADSYEVMASTLAAERDEGSKV